MNKMKSFTVSSRDLGREIQKAERADGYLIVITRKNGTDLRHVYFTRTFPREDISKSLKEHEKLLKKEMPPTSMKSEEAPEIERQKTLPPEYRNKEE